MLTFGPSGERLFRKEVIGYTYDSGSTEYLAMFEAERVETDEYKPDGTGVETVDDETTGEHYTVDLHIKDPAKLDEHFGPVPAFGEYTPTARPYRDQPPVPFG